MFTVHHENGTDDLFSELERDKNNDGRFPSLWDFTILTMSIGTLGKFTHINMEPLTHVIMKFWSQNVKILEFYIRLQCSSTTINKDSLSSFSELFFVFYFFVCFVDEVPTTSGWNLRT